MGFEIPNAKVGSFAAGSITSADYLQDSNKPIEHWRGLQVVIYRPGAATAADEIRFAGALTNTTGLLAHTGANYADTTVGTETVELWFYGIRPDLWVEDAINRALEHNYYQTWRALSIFDDGDMADSATTAYTAATGATLTKSTTARRNYFRRALRVQNDSANDYAQSSTVGLQLGDELYVWAIASVDAGGPAELVLYDITGSAEFGTAKTHNEEQPHLMYRQESIPTAANEIAVRLQGDGATGDVYWSALGGYRMSDRRIYLDSTFDERFKVESLAYLELNNPNAADGYDAMALEAIEIPKDAYDFIYEYPAPNPRAIQFHTLAYHGRPLVIQGRLPYSEEGTLAAEADSTACPLDLAESGGRIELFTPAYIRELVPEADRLQAEARADYARYGRRFEVKGPADRRPVHNFPFMPS